MRRISSVFLLLLAFSSCRKDEMHPDLPSGRGEDETYNITVSTDIPDNQGQIKSSFGEDDLTKINNLNVFIYHEGKLLADYCRYFADMSSLMLSFPYGKDGFNIYMVGNVGQLTPPYDESQLPSLGHLIESYDDFRSNGAPVANAFLGYKKGMLAHFGLKMMLGRYNISFRTSATDARYLVRDVRLINCALDVYPFSGSTPASVFALPAYYNEHARGDVLTEDDIDALNAGQKVALYFVENLQGELLPDNKDRRRKIPSVLNGIEKGLADRCTYLEITADILTPGAEYKNGKYRFYLGQNETTDFSIKRNTSYDVTLDFTQNMVNEEEWRIEVGAPEVVGVKLDKEEAMVIKGAEDMIFVQACDNYGNLMDFDINILSSNGYINVEKVQTDYCEDSGQGPALGLRFTSNVDLCGLYPFGSEPTYKTETVRISSRETYNGKPIYTKDIKVRIYDKLFPLLIKLEKVSGSSAYSIVLRGRNPMGLGLTVSSSYTYGTTSSSTSTVFRGRYVVGQTVYNNSINDRSITSCGSLSSGVTVSNLSRIDFTVKGLTETSSRRLLYPKLSSPSTVYIGEGNEAHFGPGTAMYPAKYDDLADDEYLSMGYRDYGFDLGYTNSEWGGWTSNEDYNLDHKREQDLSTGFRYSDYYAQHDSKFFFEFGDGMGVHIPAVGAYKHDDHGFQKQNENQYASVPFYFVNAGLTAFYTMSTFHYKKETDSDKGWNGFNVKMYGPGRDLFFDNRTGTALNNVHEMIYWITRWKTILGKTRTKQQSQSYSGQLYMTINGSSAWTGCDTSEYGYFTAAY